MAADLCIPAIASKVIVAANRDEEARPREAGGHGFVGFLFTALPRFGSNPPKEIIGCPLIDLCSIS